MTSSSLRHLWLNTGYLFGAGGATTLLNAAQAVLCARLLGASLYGEFALIVASAMLIQQLADFRTWEVAANFISQALADSKDDDARSLAKILLAFDLLVGAVALLALLALSPLLANHIVHDPRALSLLVVYGLSLPASAVASGASAGVLRAFEGFHTIAIKSIGVALLRLLLTAAVLLAGLGLSGLIVAIVVTEVLNAVISFVLAARIMRRELGPIGSWGRTLSLGHHPGLKRFLAHSWLSGTIKAIQSRLDVPVLGAVASATAVGYYRLALDLADLVSKLALPLQTALLPFFARIQTPEQRAIRNRVVRQLTAGLAAILLPAAAIAALLGERIMVYAGGPSYAAGGIPFAILVAGLTINTILCWTRPLLLAQGRIDLLNSIALVAGLAGLVLLLMLAPRIGATGAAIAIGSVYAMTAVLNASATMMRTSPFHRRSATQPIR